MAQEQLRPGGVLFEMKKAHPGHCIRLSHIICSFFCVVKRFPTVFIDSWVST